MERRRRIDDMNCAECQVLIHALIDGELDAGHTSDVEAHVATCPACASELQAFRAMRDAMAEARLKESAPAHLRARIEAALPSQPVRETGRPVSALPFRLGSWRTFLGGLTVGTALSAAVAATLVVAVIHNDQGQLVADEVVSAHVRSLQAGHLTDVLTSDQHTVKPWFNGKLAVAPPVVDLTAQGFTLIGGRLDYIDGEAAASIVYRRRNHVINLFVARHTGAEHGGTKVETVHGFNVRRWTAEGLDFWAVSDINAEELDEFGQKFIAAMQSPSGHS
jgi:anti-sigma factor RsiW